MPAVHISAETQGESHKKWWFMKVSNINSKLNIMLICSPTWNLQRCRFVSPVLAALCDPLPHGGVEGLSAHMWVLTVRVEQPSQGSQPVLVRTLSRHGLQVLQDGGGQHISWKDMKDAATMIWLQMIIQARFVESTLVRLPELEVLHVLYMMSRSSCSENPPVSLLTSSLVSQPGDSHTEHAEMSKT